MVRRRGRMWSEKWTSKGRWRLTRNLEKIYDCIPVRGMTAQNTAGADLKYVQDKLGVECWLVEIVKCFHRFVSRYSSNRRNSLSAQQQLGLVSNLPLGTG